MKDIEGKTTTGFEYKIEVKRLNDMELLEVFAELDTNPVALPRALEMLFGAAGKKALYDHVRTKSGEVPIDSIEKELSEILSSVDLLKN